MQFLLRVEMAGGVKAGVQGWDAAGIYERWVTVGQHALKFVADHRHAFNDAHIGVAAAGYHGQKSLHNHSIQ